MIIVRNNILPFGHHDAVNLFGVLFVKRNIKVSASLLNHEKIHSQQMRELLWVFFYILYVAEWLVRLSLCRFDAQKAYLSISFEREAYAHDHNLAYLRKRKLFAQWR